MHKANPSYQVSHFSVTSFPTVILKLCYCQHLSNLMILDIGKGNCRPMKKRLFFKILLCVFLLFY